MVSTCLSSILIKMKQNFLGHTLPSKGKRKKKTEEKVLSLLLTPYVKSSLRFFALPRLIAVLRKIRLRFPQCRNISHSFSNCKVYSIQAKRVQHFRLM